MRSWAHVTIQQPKVGDTISLDPPLQTTICDSIILSKMLQSLV